MRELFGEDGYYLELQDHGIKAQKQVNAQIIRLSEETGIPLIATNDAHYLRREDAEMQDILMCIQTGKRLEEPRRPPCSPATPRPWKTQQKLRNCVT